MSTVSLLGRVDEILIKADMPDRHTHFQIEKFIIGKEITGHAQLWQIVRELQSRKDTVDSLEKQIMDANDALDLLDIKIEREKIAKESVEKNHKSQIASYTIDETMEKIFGLNIKEYEINIRKLEREQNALVKATKQVQKKHKGILEEMNFLLMAYDRIIKVVGEFKPLDDPTAQKEMWNEKFLEEFNLRIVLRRGFDPEFVRSALCLSDDSPVKQHLITMLNAEIGKPERIQPQVNTSAKVIGPKK